MESIDEFLKPEFDDLGPDELDLVCLNNVKQETVDENIPKSTGTTTTIIKEECLVMADDPCNINQLLLLSFNSIKTEVVEDTKILEMRIKAENDFDANTSSYEAREATKKFVEESTNQEFLEGLELLKTEEVCIKSEDKQESTHIDETEKGDTTVYRCNHCDYHTTVKRNAKRHQLRHVNPEEVPLFKCSLCDYETVDKNYLCKHLKRRHKITKGQIVIKNEPVKTEKAISYQKALKTSGIMKVEEVSIKSEYIEESIPTGLKKSNSTVYQCNQCDYNTTSKRNIKRHQIRHTNRKEFTRFKCSLCDYETVYKSALIRHAVCHKNNKNHAVFKCDQCNFQTMHKAYLTRHHYQHERPLDMLQCGQCRFKTIDQCELNKHANRHKSITDKKVLKCTQCEFHCLDRENFKIHVLRHSNLGEVSKLNCSECEYRTNFRGNLRRHLLRHKNPNELETFKCKFCSYKTLNKGALPRHLLLHRNPGDITMFKCDLCDYEAIVKGDLTRHIKRHRDPEKNVGGFR